MEDSVAKSSFSSREEWEEDTLPSLSSLWTCGGGGDVVRIVSITSVFSGKGGGGGDVYS